MGTKNPKEHYEAPQTAVFEVKQESLICSSPESPYSTRRDYDYEIW